MFKKVDKLLIFTAIIVIMLGITAILITKTNVEIKAKKPKQMNINYSTTENNTWDVSKTEDGSVIATFSENGTMTISGTGDMKDWDSSLEIPWYSIRQLIKQIVIEEGITSIGDGAFSACSFLTSIEIADSVTVIGGWAFSYCTQLTNIEIPSSVISINSDTFYYCYNLKHIDVKDGNAIYCDVNGVLYSKDKTEIIRYPIGKTETEYTILNSVTSIGGSAFDGCYKLKKIEIPSGVTNIGYHAFYSCEGLIDIKIPSGVTNISSYAFDGCRISKFVLTENTTIEIPNILKRAQNETDILYSNQGLSFTNCTIENEKIKINDGEQYAIIEVEDGLLEGLELGISYNSWDISKTGDNSLRATLDENGVFTIYGIGDMKDCDGVHNCPWYNIKYFIRRLEIQDGVTSVKLSAFDNCDHLTNVQISSSVTDLGEGDADILYCYFLTDINVDSNNIKYCDDNGVLYTKDKTELIRYPVGKFKEEYRILSDVKTIRKVAFDGAWYLKNIYVPSSVVEIGSYAFAYCDNLKNVIIPKSVTTIGKDILYDSNETKILCYKDSYVETYAKENEIQYQIIHLSSTQQTIDEQNLIIKGIKPETTIEKIKETLQSDIPYEILDNTGNVIRDTSVFLATGYELKLNNNQKYTIVVKGDLNGDGSAKLSDLSKLKLAIVRSTELEAPYKEAADLNEDGNVKLSDLSKMKLYLVGKGSL